MTQAQVEKLSLDHRPPHGAKFERRKQRLDKLIAFYSSRVPTGDEGLDRKFLGFVSALRYAKEVMCQYQALTKKLDRAANEKLTGLPPPRETRKFRKG